MRNPRTPCYLYVVCVTHYDCVLFGHKESTTYNSYSQVNTNTHNLKVRQNLTVHFSDVPSQPYYAREKRNSCIAKFNNSIYLFHGCLSHTYFKSPTNRVRVNYYCLSVAKFNRNSYHNLELGFKSVTTIACATCTQACLCFC